MAIAAGTIIDNRFEIIEEIGHGGMGVVYRARQKDFERDVAIKFLRDSLTAQPDKMKRFRREAHVISKLDHPNIVRIYAVGVEHGRPYIAMEYLQGRQLSDIIADRGPLAWREAIPLFIQACDALSYAHENYIVHRDIKPSNIVASLDSAGKFSEAKIVDFGIAKSLHAVEGEKLTQTEMVLGSVFYLSPGQFQGRAAEPCSDIYSLGCTFFEVLTGRPPFAGDTIFDTIHKKSQNEIPVVNDVHPTAEIPTALESVLASMMQSAAENRVQSAAQIKEWLVKIANNEPIELKLQHKVVSTEEKWWSKPRFAAIAGCVAFAAFGAIAMQMQTQMQSQQNRADVPASPQYLTTSADERRYLGLILERRAQGRPAADELSNLSSFYTHNGFPDYGAVAAKEALSELGTRAKTSDWSMCSYQLGSAEDQLGDFTSASEHLRDALETRPRGDFAYAIREEQMQNYLLAHNFADAKKVAKDIANHGSDRDEGTEFAKRALLTVYPAIAMSASDYEEAFDARQEAVKAASGTYSALAAQTDLCVAIAEMGTKHPVSSERWAALRRRPFEVSHEGDFNRIVMCALIAKGELLRGDLPAARSALRQALDEGIKLSPPVHAYPSAVYQKTYTFNYCYLVLSEIPLDKRGDLQERLDTLLRQQKRLVDKSLRERRIVRLPLPKGRQSQP